MNNKLTGKMINVGGIPLHVPNDITNSCKDFHISYNNVDTKIYGCDTTALVTSDHNKFLILNGDHRKEYNEIIVNGGGYIECLKYFISNSDLQNEMSENWHEKMEFNNGVLTIEADKEIIDLIKGGK